MPTIQVNDITMYYEIHGQGEPLVLILGLAADISEFDWLIQWLAQRYQVLAFDNRGAGRTDKPDILYTVEMMAQDTVDLLLAIGMKRAHIIGISLGGRIALELVLKHAEVVNTLILVSTSARIIKTVRRSLLLSVFPRLPLFKGEYPQPYFAFLRQRDASSSYNCTDQLSKIQIPTVIMHGKRDKTSPYVLAQELQAGIKDSTLLSFEGGHLFFLMQERHHFLAEIVRFLS